ncbi:MAG TPA: carboxypeptidase-like regulatory domain-containing protein, partial [Planctomycetota bacterium]|nr:carboxypeptidase-like regulatory domain-containing protein [Planctomycetota bacterium]
DARGVLRIEKLPCGMPIVLQPRDPAWPFDSLGVVHIDPHARILRHSVVLARTATLIGKLQFADGRTAADVALGWQTYPLDYGSELPARSDSDGRFRISKVAAKPGELRFEFAGCVPVLATPRPGETKDLGTIVLAEAHELSGHLTSRWLDAANGEGRADQAAQAAGAQGADAAGARVLDRKAEQALEGVELRAFRAGRVLAAAEKQGQLNRGREFSARVTDGPLELVVSRGGFFFAGIAQPGEILARVELEHPRAGIEISLDERTGALDVQLGERRPREGEAVQIQLDALDAALVKSYPFVAGGSVSESGVARFCILPVGRQRAVLKIGEVDSVALGEIDIVAGQCASAKASAVSSCVLHGIVRNARGEPIANASIRARAHRTFDGATDAEGHFRFEGVAPGTYLFTASHGDFGTVERRDVRVTSAQDPPLEIVLGGWASLVGHVRANGELLVGLTVHAQPVNSNDSYSSITDEHGTFRLERLPAGRLRVWAQERFMEIHDLAAGEARDVVIELGESSLMTFTRAGAPIVDLDGVRALAFEREAVARSEWRLAKLQGGGTAELDLPAGRILFDVTRARSGSNETWLALEDHASGTVELAQHSITLESATPWNGPLPRAMLLSIEGREVVSMWGGVIVLAVERDDRGRVVVPCLPAGSRVKLSGFDAQGGRHEETLDVPASISVRWP